MTPSGQGAGMRVTALNVHPVKSTAIRPLRTMTVTLAGPRADREWIVVDAEGKPVSARELQALFSVRADTPDTDPTQTGALRLRAPGHPTLEVDHPTGDPEPVRLSRHDLSGVPAGEAADAWLRRVLGRDDLRLLWCDDPNRRRVSDDPDDPARARFPDAYLHSNKLHAATTINTIPGLITSISQATYLLWIDVSGLTDNSTALQTHIRRNTGLVLSDGATFQLSGTPHLRMNVACPRTRLNDALTRLRTAIDQLPASTLGASS